MDQTPELTEVEMVEILKAIARDGRNGAARIAAIKELRSIVGGDAPSPSVFEGLYEVSNPQKSKRPA